MSDRAMQFSTWNVEDSHSRLRRSVEPGVHCGKQRPVGCQLCGSVTVPCVLRRHERGLACKFRNWRAIVSTLACNRATVLRLNSDHCSRRAREPSNSALKYGRLASGGGRLGTHIHTHTHTHTQQQQQMHKIEQTGGWMRAAMISAIAWRVAAASPQHVNDDGNQLGSVRLLHRALQTRHTSSKSRWRAALVCIVWMRAMSCLEWVEGRRPGTEGLRVPVK